MNFDTWMMCYAANFNVVVTIAGLMLTIVALHVENGLRSKIRMTMRKDHRHATDLEAVCLLTVRVAKWVGIAMTVIPFFTAFLSVRAITMSLR